MSVFHAYDVRGLIDSEITPQLAYKIGVAMARFTNASQFVVGRDMRDSSIPFADSLCRGLASNGAKIIDIGLCSTPLFYFAVTTYKTAGVMVTASHNPAEYNGFKLMNTDLLPIGEDSGIRVIEKMVGEMGDDESQIPAFAGMTKQSDDGVVVEKVDVLSAYIAKVNTLVPFQTIALMSVVVDAGNGMGGYVGNAFFDALPVTTEKLYFELDGSFPNHEANPIKFETLRELSAQVVANGATLGIAYDGDADRVGFVDEKGIPLSGDVVATLLAREMLRLHPGSLVLGDIRCTRGYQDEVEMLGGKYGVTKVGHAHVKNQMAKEGAVFAGELSEHYYFDEFVRNESPEFAIALLLAMVTREQKPLSEIVAEVTHYAHSEEINFSVVDKQSILDALLHRYQDGEINKLDGVKIVFANWWCSVRASNTENKLRLVVEADTQELLQEKITEVSGVITGLS